MTVILAGINSLCILSFSCTPWINLIVCRAAKGQGLSLIYNGGMEEKAGLP